MHLSNRSSPSASSSSSDMGYGGDMGGGNGGEWVPYNGHNEIVLTPYIEQQPMEYRPELTVTQGAVGGWFILAVLAAFSLGLSVMGIIRKAKEAKEICDISCDIALRKMSDEAAKVMQEYNEGKEYIPANPAYLRGIHKIRVRFENPFWMEQIRTGGQAYYEVIRKKIREAQQEAGYTNAEMARKLGWNRSTYASCVHSQQKLYVHQLVAIADVLDEPITRFLDLP